MKCVCGSNQERYALNDARGIFCGYVCDECVEEKKEQFNPDIFEDANYYADEPIEPEDYY